MTLVREELEQATQLRFVHRVVVSACLLFTASHVARAGMSCSEFRQNARPQQLARCLSRSRTRRSLTTAILWKRTWPRLSASRFFFFFSSSFHDVCIHPSFPCAMQQKSYMAKKVADGEEKIRKLQLDIEARVFFCFYFARSLSCLEKSALTLLARL